MIMTLDPSAKVWFGMLAVSCLSPMDMSLQMQPR